MKLKELLEVVPDNYKLCLMDSDPDNYSVLVFGNKEENKSDNAWKFI